MLHSTHDGALAPLPSAADWQFLSTTLSHMNPAHPSTVLLQLGAQQGRLLVNEGRPQITQPMAHPLPVGLEPLAMHTFKNQMPSEAQLEHGIMLVEDAVMPMAQIIPSNAVLVTADPYLLDVGLHALGLSLAPAGNALQELSRDAVEALFERLAYQAMRPHLPLGGLPPSPQWAAALLILREALHHWQITSIQLWSQGLSMPSSNG